MFRTFALLASLLGIAACHVPGPVETDGSSPPNIVLIISDDQAWTDYGFMGHRDIASPNLDRLAAESIVFRRGYVPTSLCRPSLMTLVTGHYAHRHGVTGNDPSPEYAARGSGLYREREAQLFDLLADPREENNVRDQHPAVVARLTRRISDWYPVTERKTLTSFE